MISKAQRCQYGLGLLGLYVPGAGICPNLRVETQANGIVTLQSAPSRYSLNIVVKA